MHDLPQFVVAHAGGRAAYGQDKFHLGITQTLQQHALPNHPCCAENEHLHLDASPLHEKSQCGGYRAMPDYFISVDSMRESLSLDSPAASSLAKEIEMPEVASACPLTLDVERSGDQIVVRCRGKLVAGACDPLYSRVRQLIPDAKCITLDLTDLTHMDSMGLGTIVRLYVSAKTAGCRLQLVNVGPRIRQLLGITNLLSVLTDMCEQGVTIRF